MQATLEAARIDTAFIVCHSTQKRELWDTVTCAQSPPSSLQIEPKPCVCVCEAMVSHYKELRWGDTGKVSAHSATKYLICDQHRLCLISEIEKNAHV